VFLRNPLPFLADLPHCDVSAATDALPPRIYERIPGRFSKENKTDLYLNGGILFWRRSPRVLALIDDFMQPQWRLGKDDQKELHAFLLQRNAGAATKTGLSPTELVSRQVCLRYGGLDINVLPPMLFPNYLQFTERDGFLPALSQTAPVALHFVRFLMSAAAGASARFALTRIMGRISLIILRPSNAGCGALACGAATARGDTARARESSIYV